MHGVKAYGNRLRQQVRMVGWDGMLSGLVWTLVHDCMGCPQLHVPNFMY